MSDSPKFIGSTWGRLSWSEWIALDAPLGEYQRVVSNRGGLYRVRGSGISELGVRVDGGAWLPISSTGTFTYPLDMAGVNHFVEFIASDNTLATPNVSVIASYTVSYDATLMPVVVFTDPAWSRTCPP